MSNVMPIKIEVIGSQFEKSVGWTVTSMAAGTPIAGPVGAIGAIVDLATQGSNQKFHYIVKFSDGTQKTVTYDDNKLLDLVIWSWRINNKKTENDYVTFGMNFLTLRRGMLIPANELKRLFGTSNKQVESLGEAWQRVRLEPQLTKFLKSEIQRCFKQQKNDVVILEETLSGGLKIPSKTSAALDVIVGLNVVVALVGLVALVSIPIQASKTEVTSPTQVSKPEVTSPTQASESEPNSYTEQAPYEGSSPNQTSETEPTTQTEADTYECAEQTGMGERVSREDIVRLGECMRDRGYSIDPYR